MKIKDRKKGHAKVTPLGVLKYLGAKIKTAILLFVATVTMVLAVGAPAQAGPVDWIMGEGENFILSTFCTEPGTGYKVSPVGMPLPNSGDVRNPDHLPLMNAAEIMGNSLHFTSWYGWKNNESVQGDGKDTGSGAVAAVGGKDNNGGISDWKADEGKYPSFELQGSCLEGTTVFNTMVGNVMLQGSYLLVYATSFMLDLNSGGVDGPLGTTMSGLAENLTGTILDHIVWQFFIPFIMLGALVLAYFGLVKKQWTIVMTGVLKVLVAGTIIAYITFNPNVIIDATSKVQAVAGGLTTSIVTGGLAAIDPVAKEMCETGVIDGNKVEADNRQTSCIMWYAFYYKPWVVGQFGSYSGNYMTEGAIPGGSTNLGDPLTGGRIDKTVTSGGYSSNNDIAHVYARAMVDDGTDAVNTKMRTMYNVTAHLLARDMPVTEFAGEMSSTRIAYGAAASVAAICAMLLVGSIMIPLMGVTLALFFMAIFVALKMLIALVASHSIQPQIEAVGTVLGLFIQMVMLNIFAGTALVVIVTIAANTLDTFANMLFCIVICFAGIVYRKQILKMFDIGTYFGMATNTPQSEGMGIAKMTHMAHHAAQMFGQGGTRAAQGTKTAGKALTSRNLPVQETKGAGKRIEKQESSRTNNAPAESTRSQETATPRKSVGQSVRENGVRATARAGAANTVKKIKEADSQRLDQRAKNAELRKAGYRKSVPLSTRGTAAVAGFVVTNLKGEQAGDAFANNILAKGGNKQVNRNEAAMARVDAIRQQRADRDEAKAEALNAKRESFHAPRVEAEERRTSAESTRIDDIKKNRQEAEAKKQDEEKRRERIIAQEQRREADAQIRKEYRESKKAEQKQQSKTVSAPKQKEQTVKSTSLPPLRTMPAVKPEIRKNSPTPRSK